MNGSLGDGFHANRGDITVIESLEAVAPISICQRRTNSNTGDRTWAHASRSQTGSLSTPHKCEGVLTYNRDER